MYPYFTPHQYIPLLISGILIFLSIVCFQFSKKYGALSLLFFGTLILGYFIANLDPFLHLWDEQYHALVAKNCIETPLKPTLYSTPLFKTNHENWVYNHVWLHKQPLFLWQIALSLKTFGISALSVRIPSIIMHSVAVLMIYKIGKITRNERVGFWSALLFGVSFYFLELISGKFPTEHNDSAFIFYVIASFWAWFQYQETKKRYWLVLIGLFSGCAILVKWLVGLLIYSVWWLSLGSNGWQNWLKIKSYFPLLLSLLLTVLVVAPWQLYIGYTFPVESLHEYQLNSKHFFEVVENHSGDYWFHYTALQAIYGYGDLIPLLIVIGILVFVKKTAAFSYKIVILSSILITYLFFTLAATKLTSFTTIVCPFIFIGLATLLEVMVNFYEKYISHKGLNAALTIAFITFIGFLMLNLNQIELNHTDREVNQHNFRKLKIRELSLFQEIDAQLKGDKYVVFNLNTTENSRIAFMFFYDHLAVDYLPNKEEINYWKNLGLKTAIIQQANLPTYLTDDEYITSILLKP